MENLPENYEERKWLSDNFDKVVTKYSGKHIAIYKQEVIVSADTLPEFNKILITDFPQIKPFLVTIPKDVITFEEEEEDEQGDN